MPSYESSMFYILNALDVASGAADAGMSGALAIFDSFADKGSWTDKRLVLEMLTGYIPENQMKGKATQWFNTSRHLFWLYDFEPTFDPKDAIGEENGLIGFRRKHDTSWLHGPYAAVIYKALLARRLNQ